MAGSFSVSRSRRARTSLLAAFSLLAALVPVVVLSGPSASAATAPDHVTQTVQGCRNDGTIILPNGSGQFICPTAAYTGGNLGKGWNELDLVPFRLTTSTGNAAPATQTYDTGVAFDAEDAGHPGYDVISQLVLNTTLSAASCVLVSQSAQQDVTPGFGGIDRSIGRTVQITQPRNTTCVFDYYGRLALGSHLFPGSSLHGNLSDGTLSGTNQDVPIPVKEIQPQELAKDMSATQGSDHVWDVVKSPTPATLNFTNTCDPSAALSAPVAIQVSWTKEPATASGPITVVTHVYAKNPASRVITVNVTDNIYSGLTLLDTASSGATDVPANTANFLVLTHTTTVPAGTTDLNDIATATYTDKVTGIPVPGTTQATASAAVQLSGPELNQNAVITDVESITGAGLSYSADSFSGASGSFDNGYVAGTPTTGSVSWTSASQSGSGSVTFNKTIYATAASVVTGALSDTATLTGSDGFTTSAGATVDLSTNASTSLSVSKTTSLKIASAQSFTFHLISGGVATGDIATVSMPAGSNGPVSSNTISGLSPTGTYSFHEDATAPYGAQDTSSVTFALVPGDITSCSAVLNVSNNAAPATAQVRKDTVPISSGAWTFTLSGPGGLSETLNNVHAGAGYVPFTSVLDSDGGTYTITETPQVGYDLTGTAGDVGGDASRVTTGTLSCSFTLNLATDSGKVFECAFTNTQRGTIIVKKVTNPAGAAGSFTFTGDASGSIGDGGSITVSNLPPGTYTSSEANPAPAFDLTGLVCDDGSSTTPSTTSVATRTATFKLDPGETVTCTFTNTQRGTIIVKKVTNPVGAAGSFTYTGDASGSIGDGGSITVPNLTPGTYTSTEGTAVGFDLTGISCDDGASATPSTTSVATRTATFKLDPGETVTCTFTNTQRGHARVVKTVNGAAPSGTQAFTFQLRQGASGSDAGTILETGVANAADGGVINFATYLVPGTTYQLCEQMMPGWMTTLGPPFFTVYNPSGDNSVVCTDFTVVAGQTRTFAIDNTPPPGGRALTIGFWKNWASCAGSSGKQKPVLDQTLLAAAAAGKPVTIGLLVLNPSVLGATTACTYAVNLLNKSTITGGKKMSSDPLFNLAAQLVAADLNVAAGAGVCSGSVNAINQAQALLLKYHFDGNGYSPKLTAADATLANSLATTLDRYNNNLLC